MASKLQLAFITWHSRKNNLQHRTAEMGGQQVIARRGQPFTITLHFRGRGYLHGDSLHLIAETGPQPDQQLGTQSIFPVGTGWLDSRHVWRATASAASEPRSTDIVVRPPAGAPIGRYQLKIRIDSDQTSMFYYLGDFILLFNAWCPDDDVYLASELEREEFVLNEQGLIYQGNKDWIRPVPWNFGQLEEGIVDISLKLLDRSLHFLHDPGRDCSLRNSPVYVSRVLSAMINSNDDNGVLLGNWSEDYSGGIRPTEWSSSIAILTQWDQRGQPVKFGQCWVFAAVMCTVLRCLGIPSRVVTNFDSGHEKEGNLIIDVFYDKAGHLLPTESKDSIWNFHVWTECWMARRDLPPGYHGWQVLDATPQERSNGLYCCGPAPVRAIREGELDVRFDAPFVFSMVNADRVAWLLDGARKEKLQWDTSAVGNNISTKCVGSNEREDITSAYKYPEGSPSERRVFLKALGQRQPLGTLVRSRSGALPVAFSASVEDNSRELPATAQTSLKLRLVESPEVGQDIQLVLVACNWELAHKELKLSLNAQAVLHDGRPRPPFWQETLYLSLCPKEEKELPWQISYQQYGPQLGEDKQLRIIALGEENTTWQKTLAEKTITMASPSLAIHVLASVVVNQPFPLQVVFANPLSEPVASCILTMEGSGLVKGQPQIQVGPLGPRKQTSVRLQLTPYKSGPRQLHVTLKSSQFPPVKGHKQLQVAPCSGWRCRRD